MSIQNAMKTARPVNRGIHRFVRMSGSPMFAKSLASNVVTASFVHFYRKRSGYSIIWRVVTMRVIIRLILSSAFTP